MKVAPVNDAPVITTDTSAVIIPEDEPFSFKGTATDVDGDILQISYEGYPDWLTLEGDSLVGTPLIGGIGKMFYVIASDGLLADTLKLISYVDEVNDAPSISGTDTSVAEDNSISFIKAMFTISDEETIDDDLILTVLSGSKYSLAGNILTPVANYVGDLSVKIEVSDGEKMDTATVKVVVTPVNDAPVLASVTNQSTAENTPLTLTLEMIEESDTDNTLTDASIVIGAGNNYNVSGLTITPTLNYVGDLTVPVSVTDGALSSKTVVMTITVEAAVAIEVVDRRTVVEQFLAYPNPVNSSSRFLKSFRELE